MTLTTQQRRFLAAMLSGLSVGLTALALIYGAWPAAAGPLRPVALAMCGVVGAATGAFGSLLWLAQMRPGG